MRPDPITPSIDELCELAASRPAEEWGILLDAAFAGDPELARQAWICLQALRVPLDGGAPTSLDARYEPGPLLGQGHTATVWRAYDRRLRREVAIKVFREGDPVAINDILAEARAASDIVSEYVVRVHDVHDSGTPCIVMELVGEHDPRTGSLVPATSAASSRPRDMREALCWVREAARGVHDAHLRNVFHRDLTPQNILVTPLSRRTKIADFGLAIRAGAHTAPHGEPALDAPPCAHRIAGTPQYMAPEQARGLAISFHPSSAQDRTTLVGLDVWGLGAIAFDLITGRPPWPRDANAWEVAVRGDVPPIHTCANGRRVSRRVCAVVQRALARDPAKRYASAKLLADEIDALLACRPTSFDRSVWQRLLLWTRRNPKLLVTTALALILAVSSFTAYAATVRLRQERDRLMTEIAESVHDVERLETQAQRLKRDLAVTEADLQDRSESLEAVQEECDGAKAPIGSADLVNASAAMTRQTCRAACDCLRRASRGRAETRSSRGPLYQCAP